jgi:hypothetical protein
MRGTEYISTNSIKKHYSKLSGGKISNILRRKNVNYIADEKGNLHFLGPIDVLINVLDQDIKEQEENENNKQKTFSFSPEMVEQFKKVAEEFRKKQSLIWG